MIDSAMLGGEAPTVAFPDHWASFRGSPEIENGFWYLPDSGHIRFDCCS
jgi:hypothetical protein